MSTMRKTNEVIAIFCSDIHLSHKPPIARSAEPNWYSAMERVLMQLDSIQKEHKAPIICAGDIFDHWNNCPELVNFAMTYLPEMLIIPGQHEMPNHDYGEIHRSSYRTLTKLDDFTPLAATIPSRYHDLVLVGFPYGFEPSPFVDEVPPDCIKIAVCHHYIWDHGHSYTGAPVDCNFRVLRKKLKGFDFAVFGDNHSPFYIANGNPKIINCGCLIRRKIDERKYEPSVWLLRRNHTVQRVKLDVSEDKWINPETNRKVVEDDSILELTQMLEALGDSSLDFTKVVETAMESSHKLTKRIILEALDRAKEKVQ